MSKLAEFADVSLLTMDAFEVGKKIFQ